MPTLFQKHVHCVKNTVLLCHIFQIFHEKPPVSCSKLDKERQFCQNYTIYFWPQKIIGCPFFLIFHEKITALRPKFCQKNVHTLKNTMLLCPYFVKKRPFSKKRCALTYFFLFFYEKAPALMTIFSHKNVNSVKSTLYYRAKKSIGYLFSKFCTIKSLLSCTYFVEKSSFSKNTLLLCPHFVQKNVHSLKNIMLSGHFFSNFSLKTTCCHAHMWSKNVNCVKTTLHVPENPIECFFPIFHEKPTALILIYW